MAETIIVKTFEEEQQGVLGNAILVGIGVVLIALALLVEFLVNKGFTTGSAIALIVAVPIIVLILIFKGSLIYGRLQGRTSEKGGYFWLGVIIFLILLVLGLQYLPAFIERISNPFSADYFDLKRLLWFIKYQIIAYRYWILGIILSLGAIILILKNKKDSIKSSFFRMRTKRILEKARIKAEKNIKESEEKIASIKSTEIHNKSKKHRR